MGRGTLLIDLADRWQIPHKRIEDTFRVRNSRGNLVPLVVPIPQREIVDNGILGTANHLVEKGITHRRIINKGRQIGYSVINAAESILLAEDYPKTCQYYVAGQGEQAIDYLNKLTQLCEDANHYPELLGGHPILHIDNIKPVMKKVINGCIITGFTGNHARMRGPTAINVTLDEFAWMIIRKNQQHDVYTAIKHFLKQGGQLTIQSTPRTNTDMFMEYYNNAREKGFIPYYKPVITNWKELDINLPLYIELNNERRKEYEMDLLTQEEIDKYLERFAEHPLFVYDEEKQILKQKYKIPYSWINIIELEKDRYADIEFFKQENLGIAIDERYKVLKGEWIYNNLVEGTDWTSRGDSHNKFTFGIDIAKQRDLFVIKIFEYIGTEWFCRRVEIMPVGQKYPISANRIAELYDMFRPIRISVDNTGGGIVFCDFLETISKLKNVIVRVDFSSSTKENMAENLKGIARDGKFHMLNYTEEHRLAIKHLLKVERQELDTTTRYTGKGLDQEGRDDLFWAACLAVCDSPQKKKGKTSNVVNIKAAFGKWGGRVEKSTVKKGSVTYEDIIKRIRKPQPAQIITKEEAPETEEYRDIKKLEEVEIQLNVGVIACSKTYKIIKPINCVYCDIKTCLDWSVHDSICKKVGVNKLKFRRWLDEKKTDKENSSKIIK